MVSPNRLSIVITVTGLVAGLGVWGYAQNLHVVGTTTTEGNTYVYGSLGVGTTVPAYKLDVAAPADAWKARFAGPDGSITIGPANSSWAHIYSDRPAFIFNKDVWSVPGGFSSYSTADLALKTDGTTRILARNSDGNVGVGTTAPAHRLHVFGSSSGWLGRFENTVANSSVYLAHGNAGLHVRTDTTDNSNFLIEAYNASQGGQMFVVKPNGDLQANSNAPTSCSWTSWLCGSQFTCPAGKFVAGFNMGYREQCPSNGWSPNYQLLCCEL